MNTNLTPEMRAIDEGYYSHKKCFSWSAVIVGALFGIGLSFLLNLLGLSVGITAFNKTSTQTLAIGGLIALIIISILSMFPLGWVAGYLGATKTICNNPQKKCNYGGIYGFTAWALALILSILLAMPTANFMAYTLHNLNPANPPAEVFRQPVTASSTATNSTVQTNNTTVTANTDTVALSTFVFFILFTIGLISAVIGGYTGFKKYLTYHND